jgi:hypothetical protein
LGQTCQPELLGDVVSDGSCSEDADCNDGYCASDNTCQYVTGAACINEDDCPDDVPCTGGCCVYADQRMKVAGSLAPGDNYQPFIYVEVMLFADTTGAETPVLYDWVLTYECRNMV